MTADKFDEIVEAQIKTIQIMMESKAKQYASDADRLHNFKRAGRDLDCTPERALLGMMVKQWIEIKDKIDSTGFDHNYDPINDMINYLILLKALVIERLGS